jgi:hypothetical protein
MTYYLQKVGFHVKIQIFVMIKSDQYPDPHWFGPWIRIRIEVKSWIRIRNETNADPKY